MPTGKARRAPVPKSKTSAKKKPAKKAPAKKKPAKKKPAAPAKRRRRGPRYWLMKTEPHVYSIDDLARAGVGVWEGVRNYTARNHLRAMQEGDLALFYHSSTEPPGVAGIARVAREAYPDPFQFDPASKYHDPKSPPDAPRWSAVDVAFVEKLPEVLTLAAVKAEKALRRMEVVKQGTRLSVQPVSKAHFERILAMANATTRIA